MLNYPNQLPVPKYSSGNAQKSILKCQFLTFLHINTFFVKTLVQISTSTEVNHLISKGLYQKQNGLKFILEILVALMKTELHCGDDNPFFHMT